MPDKTVAALKTVLEQERAAILAGNYAVLSELAAQKDHHFAALQIAQPEGDALASIKTYMMDNQDLISSALKGVAAAQTRITALEAVRDGLSIYDQSGKVSTVPNARQRFEKKA